VQLNNLVDVVGCHAAGEVGDVVVGGVGNVPGETMFDKRNYLQNHRDDLRLRLLREPRGNVIRNVNVVLPSNNPKALMGYVIMESTEYPTMSGSNTICVATVLLETGMLPMEEPVTRFTLEAPAGLIDVECQCRNGKVTSVRFVNQPAFVYQLDATIDVPGIGTLVVDIAWGGMCYVIVDAASAGFKLDPTEGRELRVMGERIKAAAIERLAPAVHPVHPEYPGITNLSFTNPPERVDGVVRARNAVVVSPGRIDRSPCGTGTSARLAVMHARGQIGAGEHFIHESILGTTFDAVVESTTKQGSIDAIIPSIAGQAWITQLIKVGFDPTDPFPAGYTLSDTWLEPMYAYETTT